MEALQVNDELLSQLKSIGFSESRAKKALQYSGNSSIEAAVDWLMDHENDLDNDDDGVVEIPIESVSEDFDSSIPEEESRTQELRDRASRKREEEVKELEREREKERIQSGKELAMAKRRAEEIERERFIAQKKKDKEEERRARERIRAKLQQDKEARMGIHGLPLEAIKSSPRPGSSSADKKKNSLLVKSDDSSARTELMRECLISIRLQYKEDDRKVKRALQTLVMYCRNVVNNPNEEMFRKIRLTNKAFQERVGFCREGVQFLELCGFERDGGDQFLLLPREKLDIVVLKSAQILLHSAMTNPFFGLLSK